MKVFWWQAGLHFEPENDEDSTALLVLSACLKFSDTDKRFPTSPIGLTDFADQEPVVSMDET
jgi:hypothetical protein